MNRPLTPEQAAQPASWTHARQLRQHAEDALRRSTERAARRLVARSISSGKDPE
ncbi:hypothetical protein [Streptomyces chilikensis]|uniref:Uncharacterized protein n=1 Tax=Streptomyces chilikensis TaxID=1194079 RepID=A0ABV3ERK2_9ACTN